MHPSGAGGSELSLGTAERAGQHSPPFLKAGNQQRSQQQLSVMPGGDPAGLERKFQPQQKHPLHGDCGKRLLAGASPSQGQLNDGATEMDMGRKSIGTRLSGAAGGGLSFPQAKRSSAYQNAFHVENPAPRKGRLTARPSGKF